MVQPYRRRNSIRYPGYDYARSGMIFVTICTEGRQPLFGEVIGGLVALSPAGAMIHNTWIRIPERFPEVLLDACIVMPDHLHGIILERCPDVPPPDATTGASSAGSSRRPMPAIERVYSNPPGRPMITTCGNGPITITSCAMMPISSGFANILRRILHAGMRRKGNWPRQVRDLR